MINDADLTTRLAAFIALSKFPTTDALKNAITSLAKNEKNQSDKWLRTALKVASKNHGVKLPSETNLSPSEENLLSDSKWRPVTYSGKGAAHTQPKEGQFKIETKTPTDTSWQTKITVEPGANYRLSAKIKTTGVKGNALGALLNIHELQNPQIVTKALKGDMDWTEVSIDLNSLDYQTLSVNALFGGWGQSTGTAFYKDLRLVRLIPVPKEKTATKLQPGDSVRGKELFVKHEVAACSRCHIVGGTGGVVGPALDGIATRKGPDYIRKSLLEPNADIAEGYPLPQSPMPQWVSF